MSRERSSVETRLDTRLLAPVGKPELVFGLVAPVGTPLRYVEQLLTEALGKQGYRPEIIKMSSFLRGFSLPTPYPTEDHNPAERLNRLMSRGNELREQYGSEALALIAMAHIAQQRPNDGSGVLVGKAFIVSQLKHPSEVLWFRRVYGNAFQLIGVHCSEEVRRDYLGVHLGIPESDVDQLIERDRGEQLEHGQQVAETFHRADVFVELKSHDRSDQEDLCEQLTRYIDLVFGSKIITPTRDEYGMFFAYSASLRSADLSRQVGAAILDADGTLVSVGANEVPRFGGGQYWHEEGAMRDVELGEDPNQKTRMQVLQEVLEVLSSEWADADDEKRKAILADASKKLKKTRLMQLTEFNRSVHAEMEAILAASRLGRSVKGHDLYTTTFPCHNCAKHIVAAGIKRVVYIEPYPKSLAVDLHGDSISTDEKSQDRVKFVPFTGVSPRMYPILFSTLTPEGERIRRKKDDGSVIDTPTGLRIGASPLSYVDRELTVAHTVKSVLI